MTVALRPATQADEQRLFDWRNDPVTRANSIVPDMVDWRLHCAWIREVLKQPRRKLLIAERDGQPVGTVRVDQRGDVDELSWTVAPEARRQGVGTEMVKLGVTLARAHPIAKIKPGNEGSLRIADHCGFKYDRMEDGLMVMKR